MSAGAYVWLCSKVSIIELHLSQHRRKPLTCAVRGAIALIIVTTVQYIISLILIQKVSPVYGRACGLNSSMSRARGVETAAQAAA